MNETPKIKLWAFYFFLYGMLFQLPRDVMEIVKINGRLEMERGKLERNQIVYKYDRLNEIEKAHIKEEIRGGKYMIGLQLKMKKLTFFRMFIFLLGLGGLAWAWFTNRVEQVNQQKSRQI